MSAFLEFNQIIFWQSGLKGSNQLKVDDFLHGSFCQQKLIIVVAAFSLKFEVL